MTARFGKTLLGMAALALVLVFGAVTPVLADARVALVVGNGDYEGDLGKLKNPTNDAALMADTLKGLGFDVVLVENADQKEMKRAIREFGQKLRGTGGNGIGLFYYAGHGVQVDGENYLLPIGAQIEAEGDVELEAVSASSVLSQMQYAGNAVNLVFLDACRNNPLTRNFRSGSRGLARVDAPRGSFVGYSTAPGDVSVDGDAQNSPYTLALVEELKLPGTSIEEAHRAVRAKVLAATNQRQTPWDSSSLTGPVVLAKAEEPAPAETQTAAVTPAPAASGGGNNQQAELLFWDSIKNSDNPATFEAYLKQFPNGVFAGLAAAKVDELKAKSGTSQTTAAQQEAAAAEAENAAWTGIKDSDNPAMFEAFLKQFPNGTFAPLASAKLAALQKPVEVAAAAAPEAVAEPAPAETQSAAVTPEPTPIQVEAMDAVYVAKKSANVRAAPDTGAKVLSKVAADQAVDVTGKVAGGEWLRVAVKGNEGFVSASLMARSSAEEVAAWQKLKGKPTEAGAQSFLAAYPEGPFQPKAKALLAKMQKPEPAAEAAPVVAAAPAVAPTQQQQAAVTPPQPAKNVVRISSALREKVERYISNSEAFGGYYRYLAVNPAGDKIGMSNCKQFTSYFQDACGGASNPDEGARKIALKECGRPNECRLIFQGAKKIGDFEIEWY
jgi:uncharacterized caspase-like protein